jgi:hypothetical protein
MCYLLQMLNKPNIKKSPNHQKCFMLQWDVC